MKTQWEKVHHSHNLSVQSRNATSVMSCLAPTWLQINKMSPITRSMVSHTNPEDHVSLAQPPGVFSTPSLSHTITFFLLKVLAVSQQCSHPALHFSAFTVSLLTLYSYSN